MQSLALADTLMMQLVPILCVFDQQKSSGTYIGMPVSSYDLLRQ